MNAAGSIRAALLTAPAPGAIAVIRVVGRGAQALLNPCLKTMHGDDHVDLAPLRPTLVRIVEGNETVDEALVVLRDTADHDDLEVSIHGGVAVVQRVLALLRSRGATVTSPDALPERATAHPVEADVDRALLTCESRRLTQCLLAQRTLLPSFLASAKQLSAAERAAFDARTRVAIRLVRGIRVVLAGPPNAGKSTLANALIGRERVIIADQPGTTRDWVSEIALIDGWPVTLTDTAGIRETTDAIEVEAIRRGREQARRADVIVLLLDATRPMGEALAIESAVMRDMSPEIARVMVINKIDAVQPDSIEALQRNWPEAIAISAREQIGLPELNRAIASRLGLNQLDSNSPSGFLSVHLLPA